MQPFSSVVVSNLIHCSSRETKARHTKAAQNAAASAEAIDVPLETLEEMKPEDIVLLKQLTDKRKELLMDLDGRAVKTVSTCNVLTPYLGIHLTLRLTDSSAAEWCFITHSKS